MRPWSPHLEKTGFSCCIPHRLTPSKEPGDARAGWGEVRELRGWQVHPTSMPPEQLFVTSGSKDPSESLMEPRTSQKNSISPPIHVHFPQRARRQSTDPRVKPTKAGTGIF